MEERIDKKVTIRGVNIVYLVCMILLIAIGAIVQRWDFNYGILITEFILVAMPPMVYGILSKINIKKEFRFNRLDLQQIVLIFIIFFSGYFVAIFLNLVGNIILSFFGELMPLPVPIAKSPTEYVILLLIIAGSAGLCEEILFRGLLLRGYEKIGERNSIIFTALLFGMLHLNIQNFIGPTFLGILLGLVVYKTNSIFAGMLGHFINNSISVTLQYVIMSLPFYNSTNFDAAVTSNTQSLIASAAVFGVLAIIMGALMIMSIRALSEGKQRMDSIIQIHSAEIWDMGTIIKDFRISWPIYIAVLIFIIMSGLEIIDMMKG